MGLPLCCWSLSVFVRKLSSVVDLNVLGTSYDFVRFFIYLYFYFILLFCRHLHPASHQICLGNAANPPPLPPPLFPISFISTHTHTQRNLNPPTCLILQPSILYMIRDPLIQTHAPTNPSQFLQIPTGLLPPPQLQRAFCGCVPLEAIRVRTFDTGTITSHQTHRGSCDPEPLVLIQTQKPRHIPAA